MCLHGSQPKVLDSRQSKTLVCFSGFFLLEIHYISPMICTSLSRCCVVDFIQNNMSKLQVNQLRQLRHTFEKFDTDADGSLTIFELAALLRSLGLKPSSDQIHALLAKMDSNGNGFVEFEELVDAILHKISAEILLNQEILHGVFKYFDRDGNGFITAAELAGAMAKMGQPLTYRELMEMITEADTDGDGVISFHEFSTVMGRSASDFLGFALL